MVTKKFSPNLTPDDKNIIFQFLLQNSTLGKVHWGKFTEAASSFGVSLKTVHLIWAAAKKQIEEGLPVHFKSNKLGVPIRKLIFLDEEKFMLVLPELIGSVRKCSREMTISKSTIHRWKQSKVINHHSNALKPSLTEPNMIQRMQFSLETLYKDANDGKIKFDGLFNVVHFDEKWFYMKKEVTKYYKLPNETPQHRTAQSKRYIEKVMFMCAVARPQYSTDGQCVFDGKIGMFPFTEMVPAKRGSVNRPRGTLEMKPIQGITKLVTKDFMINKLIPAIKAKWPANASKTIYIQQDNAPPHINNEDPEFRAATSLDGFDIHLIFQPPNSPDCNVNDLGWFRAIETIQWQTRSYTVVSLVANVIKSFAELDDVTLNKVFLSLQMIMKEILKAKGGNDFIQPHMGKDRLIKLGELPLVLEVDEDLVRSSIDHIIGLWQGDQPSYDFSGIMMDLGY